MYTGYTGFPPAFLSDLFWGLKPRVGVILTRLLILNKPEIPKNIRRIRIGYLVSWYWHSLE